MTSAWNQIERDERIRECEVERVEALGTLLGVIDVVIMAKDIPDFFEVGAQVERLRLARAAYDAADRAYRAARLA